METAEASRSTEETLGNDDIIKDEFVIKDHVRTLSRDCVSDNDKRKLDGENEAEDSKRQKTDWNRHKKLKGQNKARGVTYREPKELVFCPNLVDSRVEDNGKKCTADRCVFMHDYTKYLERKPKDLGDTCYVYSVRGHCPRGISCRFGSGHLTEDGRNKIDEELLRLWEGDKCKRTVNFLSKETQHLLRKKKYDFRKSAAATREVDKEELNKRKAEKKAGDDDDDRGDGNRTDNGDKESVDLSVEVLAPGDDSERVRERPEERKKIDWSNKLYLSPLTTVGNLPFRRICKEFGADVTCGEMAMAQSLLKGHTQEWALVRRHATEDLFGVQICGNNPHIMTRCAQVLRETSDIDFIDINLGCPIDFVYEQGSGSGLLRRPRVLTAVIKSMTKVLDIPLTVKTRTGVSCSKSTSHELMPMFRDSGVSLITVHGRSREQRYTRNADWDYIEKCASIASPTPVFGNGDILSYVDYEAARAKCPSVAGVMIGRGALIKPWIFTEIKERRNIDMTSSERFEMLKKYVNYGLEHWGSDNKGVENTRRFLLEWLSFLHRYIPVGVLVSPPQVINQRPPFYRGRDEMETLMASANCADWIKISEMLLGPVPEGFAFLPKHKANAWK